MDHNDQLKAIREKLAAARARRTSLAAEKATVKGAMKDVDLAEMSASDLVNSKAFKDAEEIVAKEGAAQDEINSLESAENVILRMLGDGGNAAGQGAARTVNGTGEQSIGWNGHKLLGESDTYSTLKSSGDIHSDAHFGTVGLGKVCTREEVGTYLNPRMAAALPTAPAGNIATDQGVVTPDVRGVFPPALLPLTLLDLIPTGTTDSNIIQYVQVAALPGYAAETAELAAKPQEGITFVDATAPVRTIAGYAKMARQALDDMAGLATLINTLIPWDVRRRLMNQMLFGDGTGQNLLGLANVAGIGAPASVAGDNVADGLLRAATTIVLSDGDPSFVALNPLTWLSILTTKATTNQYVFGDAQDLVAGPDLGNAQAVPGRGNSIWGLQVVQNRLVPAAVGGPIVGDPIGAALLVREGVNIKTSDADQDDFIKNRVTILGETRVAFPVWRPTAFAKAPLG